MGEEQPLVLERPESSLEQVLSPQLGSSSNRPPSSSSSGLQRPLQEELTQSIVKLPQTKQASMEAPVFQVGPSRV